MRLFLFSLWLLSFTAQAAPAVVTSIAPVHELTAEIMHEIGQPELLIASHASAHHFAFKPSHLRLIQKADLVIWIDRRFESGFNRVPDILSKTATGLELLPMLEADKSDGHFWYSPRLLKQSVRLITQALYEIDPENRSGYQDNADKLINKLDHWGQQTRLQLADQPSTIVTDHQFLAHFAKAFDLESIRSVHDLHDDHGGLNRLERFESYLRSENIKCLISTDANLSKLSRILIDKYQLQSISLSAENDAISSSGGILRRLELLTNAFEKCGATS